MDLINKTLATEFILVGFTSDPKISAGLFVLFFFIYLLTLAGNTFMICVICISSHLHVPMYFFLCSLSVIDCIYATTIVPRFLADLLSVNRVISLLGCGTQVYINLLMGNAESVILLVMAYDIYNAICNPLYYPVLMRWSVCYRLVAFVWFYSLTVAIVPGLLMPIRTCNPNLINHFYCEVIAVIKLSCDNTDKNELTIFSISFFNLFLPFLLIILSYVCIISSVMRIRSEGKLKAFSTCSSHIIVVVLLYGTAMIMYFGPSSQYSSGQAKYISVFYGIIIPTLNPMIYSLRNKEVIKVFLSKNSN